MQIKYLHLDLRDNRVYLKASGYSRAFRLVNCDFGNIVELITNYHVLFI